MKRRQRRRAGRRHQSRQQKLSRISVLLTVVGGLCVAAALLFAVAGLFNSGAAREKQYFLSLCYLGGGAVLLFLRWVAKLVQSRLRRTRTRTSLSDYETPEMQAMYAQRKSSVVGEAEPAVEEASNRSGMVLILTLVVLALVAGLVVQGQMRARQSLSRARASLLEHRLHLAATDAARAAMVMLTDDGNTRLDSTNDVWAASWSAEDPTGISTLVRLEDENRYFDLNNVSLPRSGLESRAAADMAMDIMTLCGDFASLRRVEALVDWTDGNDVGSRESAYYREQEPPSQAPNRVLLSWGELLRVDGFDRALFDRRARRSNREVFRDDLLDCLTLLPVARSQPIPVNLNTASKPVLLGVMGLEREALVNTILSMRSIRPLNSLEPLLAFAEPRFIQGMQRYLDVKSRFFRVTARAYADGRAENLRALVRRGQDREVEVLEWTY